MVADPYPVGSEWFAQIRVVKKVGSVFHKKRSGPDPVLTLRSKGPLKSFFFSQYLLVLGSGIFVRSDSNPDLFYDRSLIWIFLEDRIRIERTSKKIVSDFLSQYHHRNMYALRLFF